MCEPDEVDVSSLDDASLGARVEELCELADRVEAARLAALREWDKRAVWALDGAPNGGTWIAARGRLARSTAAGLLHTARKLDKMPAAAAAMAEERLAPAKVRLLARAINERTEEAFARDEEMLVAEAANLTVDQTATLVRFWLLRADADGPGDGDDPTRDAAHFSQTMSGRFRFDGNLHVEGGTIIANVLNGIVDDLRRAARADGCEAPPAPQLRAMALVEMARRATAAGDRPPAKPLVWVVAPAEALRTGVGACELAGGGHIPAATAQRLACDATMAVVLQDPDGNIVDLGRTKRTASPTQRRLLWLRDRGCTFPGCDRPPGWCDAHHVVPWEQGGETDLSNLALLCSFHHHLVHEGGWRMVRAEDGELCFYRPAGRLFVRRPVAA